MFDKGKVFFGLVLVGAGTLYLLVNFFLSDAAPSVDLFVGGAFGAGFTLILSTPW